VLFNSFTFLFAFLPLVLGGAALFARFGTRAVILWLLLASFLFYCYWNPPLVLLLLGSIIVNALLGRGLVLTAAASAWRKPVLIGGIAFNLGLLGYFKYTGFLIANAASLFGSHWAVPDIVLPIGISFFTFQQIAYLVDTYRDEVQEFDLARYALFVAFFPQLIAGPIVHHKQIVPQLSGATLRAFSAHNLAIGASIFAIGLFKKVVLADGAGVIADRAFDTAASGVALSTIDAWMGAFGFTFQLYFDFSGYSDMALGLARLFGIVLPLNFYSPYKAQNIIEFWRRWHITLSSFLKTYLYVPLGGNRRSTGRRYINLMVVMLIGGLWHGAAWTFVIWGGIHGILLVANHCWHALRRRQNWQTQLDGVAARIGAWLVTFVCVVFAWVVFRADSMEVVAAVWLAMIGGGEFPLVSLSWAQGGLREYAGGMVHLALCAVVALVAPNVFDMFRRYNCALADGSFERERPYYRVDWRPSWVFACYIAMLFSVAVFGLSAETPFLYYQF
jgi:alginate O-acetyltransferase complex protein AlgI